MAHDANNDGDLNDAADCAWYQLTDSRFSPVLTVDAKADPGRVLQQIVYGAYGKFAASTPADFNGDGFQDYTDFDDFSAAFAVGDPSADFSGDGFLEFTDFDDFVSAFEATHPAVAMLPPRIGFGGYQFDPHTGYLLARNRWYDPGLSRWLTRDPAGYVDGMNLYLYVRANPMTLIDPMGLAPDSVMDQRAAAGKEVLTPVAAAVGEALDTPTGRRVLGGAQAIGGALEATVGAAASSTGAGALLGVPAMLHGADNLQAGLRTAYSGEHTDTFTKLGIQAGLEGVGVSAQTASIVANVTDTVIGVATTFGSSTVSKGAVNGAKLAAEAGGSVQANAVARTTSQLVDEIGARAQAWGTRQGLQGTARQIGTAKHGYAKDLLDRYQSMFGSRGLETETSWLGGNPATYGTVGSVRLDVWERTTGAVWDYKFGATPMRAAQRTKIMTQGPRGITSVTEVHP